MTDTIIPTPAPTPAIDVSLDSPAIQALVELEREKIRKELQETYSGLEANRDAILDEKKKLQLQYADVDLDKYKDLKTQEAERDKKALELQQEREIEQGRFKELVTRQEQEAQELKSQFEATLAAEKQTFEAMLEEAEKKRQESIEESKSEVVSYIGKSELFDQFTKAGVNKPAFLYELTKDQFEFTKTDTGVEVKAKGHEGDLSEYLGTTLRNSSDYSMFFNPSGATGGAAQGTDKGKSVVPKSGKRLTDMSLGEKNAVLNEIGQEAYQKRVAQELYPQ